jgi:hypothetical protein
VASCQSALIEKSNFLAFEKTSGGSSGVIPMKKLVELYGWYGMAAILLAYALVSFSVIDARGLAFQILNGTGALGIVLVSFRRKAYQPGVLNIVWTFIAIAAIVKYLLQ